MFLFHVNPYRKKKVQVLLLSHVIKNMATKIVIMYSIFVWLEDISGMLIVCLFRKIPSMTRIVRAWQ
jgi:hypothetical protein